jgi:hypothetical protein
MNTTNGYTDHGSIEGHLTASDDGLSFFVFDDLTQDKVPCTFDGWTEPQAGPLVGLRVCASGRITYSENGEPLGIAVGELIRIGVGLDLKEVQGIDITGGMESSEYVRRLRDQDE